MRFKGGAVVVGVLGPFFDAPGAPVETALLVDNDLARRGLRESSDHTSRQSDARTHSDLAENVVSADSHPRRARHRVLARVEGDPSRS